MADHLPLPSKLQHLVEKRSRPDRRKQQRRKGRPRRQVDLGPLGTLETAADLSDAVLEERRTSGDRRKQSRRSGSARRTTDPPGHGA
jgi:hypothetical protein